jgi:hypothetical protein
MRIGTFENFNNKEDIQIQTAVGRLLFHITCTDATANLELVTARLRIFGPKGAVGVHDTMNIKTHFELCAQREGFYRIIDDKDDGGDDTGTTTYIGFIEVSKDGALALSSNNYLSLDIKAPQGIKMMKIWALGGPFATNKFQCISPVTVQDVVKDIPLAGVDSILIRPADVGSLKLQYPDIAPDFEREELEAIGCMINDLVYVTSDGRVKAGFDQWVELKTKDCTRATLEPATSGQFALYLLTEKSI